MLFELNINNFELVFSQNLIICLTNLIKLHFNIVDILILFINVSERLHNSIILIYLYEHLKAYHKKIFVAKIMERFLELV